MNHCGLWDTGSPACAGDDTSQDANSMIFPENRFALFRIML
ncbi:protein of unknown function [Bradyrhizobium vignae]|uniref:Uncharacterized protein n=1 Tax=Bradyrhizobium vignae TaxID=1549949 RepID=A0A2U3QDA4_9BRAD|nr:protein of unknown function [Bradyrhizobium vignae]